MQIGSEQELGNHSPFISRLLYIHFWSLRMSGRSHYEHFEISRATELKWVILNDNALRVKDSWIKLCKNMMGNTKNFHSLNCPGKHHNFLWVSRCKRNFWQLPQRAPDPDLETLLVSDWWAASPSQWSLGGDDRLHSATGQPRRWPLRPRRVVWTGRNSGCSALHCLQWAGSAALPNLKSPRKKNKLRVSEHRFLEKRSHTELFIAKLLHFF